MALKRKRTTTTTYGPKRRYKKVKMMKKPRVGKTIGKLNQMTEYRIKRNVVYTPITTSSVSDYQSVFLFRLQDIPSVADFSSLFDSYKITGVKLRIMPRVNDVSTASTNPGVFYYAFDYNDTASTPLSNLIQAQGLKFRSLSAGRPINIFIRPKNSSATYGTITGYQAANGWVDMSNQGVQYYGIKYVIPQTTTNFVLDVVATYYLKFRGVG